LGIPSLENKEKQMNKLHLIFIVVLVLGMIPLLAQNRKVENTPLPNGPQRATISVTDMTGGVTAHDLVQALVGGGVTISNIVYTGANVASGMFTGGSAAGIGIDEGIILSTGAATLALGPNQSNSTSYDNGLPGDADLNTLVTGDITYDATVLEFDFIPDTENLQFTFVMGSDEYEEYLNYHDVFAFFLNGTNIALIPGTNTPISIGTINPNVNSSYYISNVPLPGTYDIECDGFTVPISLNATVIPGEVNHIKLAVADYRDGVWDTWIFMQAETFISGYNVYVDSEPQGARIFKDGVDTALNTPATISQVTGSTSVYHVEMPGYTWIPTAHTVANIQSNQSIFFESAPPTTPVELSSFTANTNTQGFVAVRWVSESETDMLGYKVLRSDSDQLSEAMIITPLLIGATNTSSQAVYQHEDHDVEINHTYHYWLEVVNMTGSQFFGPVNVTITGQIIPEIPVLNKLGNAYPNPFKSNTSFQVDVKAGDSGTVSIYNSKGRLIRVFNVREGNQEIHWDGLDQHGNRSPSGIYLYKLSTPSINETRKMLIVK